MTFGKVMGGGFPAAAFGGRADLMQHLAPVGGVYQAGTLSGNPVATAAGLTTLRLATPEVYAHVDRLSAQLQARGRRGPDRGRRAARHPGRREPVQRVLRPRRRDAGAGLRHRRAASPPTRTRPSSTPCSTRGSTCRRARTRVGFCPPPTMMEPWIGSSRRCPARAAAAGPGRRPAGRRPNDGTAMSEQRTVVHLVRHGEVHNPDTASLRPAARLSPVRAPVGRWPVRVAEHLRSADIVHLRCSPMERAQETMAPIAGRARPAGASSTAG